MFDLWKKIPASVRFEPTCLEVKQVLEGLAGLRIWLDYSMRETNPLKFPWKNKCINKKIEETERKDLCGLIPLGQMYHIDWKTQYTKII